MKSAAVQARAWTLIDVAFTHLSVNDCRMAKATQVTQATYY